MKFSLYLGDKGWGRVTGDHPGTLSPKAGKQLHGLVPISKKTVSHGKHIVATATHGLIRTVSCQYDIAELTAQLGRVIADVSVKGES